jgi:membrane associated rhomboid family serine protease
MNGIFDDLRNEFNKTGNAVVKLILINVIIYVTILVLRTVFHYALSSQVYEIIMSQIKLPASLSSFAYKPWTLITNFFAHEGFFHILFNMLFLYWFGQVIEEYIGGRRVISLYILGGISGGVVFLVMYNVTPYLQAGLSGATLIGASGGIFAIIVGLATLLPDYTVFLLFLGAVRIKYIAAFYILLSVAELVGSNPGGNLAHLAGALVGFGFIKSLKKGVDWGEPLYSFLDFINALFAPRPSRPKMPRRERTPEPTVASSSNKKSKSEPINTSDLAPDQDEIDTILDKISKSGYESLSREEKQKLYKASQQN